MDIDEKDYIKLEAENKKLKEMLVETIDNYKWFNETINNLLKRIDKEFI